MFNALLTLPTLKLYLNHVIFQSFSLSLLLPSTKQVQIIGFNSDLYSSVSVASKNPNGLVSISLLIHVSTHMKPPTAAFIIECGGVNWKWPESGRGNKWKSSEKKRHKVSRRQSKLPAMKRAKQKPSHQRVTCLWWFIFHLATCLVNYYHYIDTHFAFSPLSPSLPLCLSLSLSHCIPLSHSTRLGCASSPISFLCTLIFSRADCTF